MSAVVISRNAQRSIEQHPETVRIMHDLSDVLDRPIRVLMGSGNQINLEHSTVYQWRTPHMRAAGVAAGSEEAAALHERGITINLWASLSPRTGWRDFPTPDGNFVYDTIRCDSHLWDEIYWGEEVMGEFGPRYVAFHTPVNMLPQADIPWDDLLAEPIRLSIDDDHLNSLQERIVNRDRDAFFRIATSRNELALTEARAQIQTQITAVRSFERRLQDARTLLRDRQAELDARLAVRVDVSENDLMTEWQKLHEHRLVESAHLNGSVLHVMTTDIEMIDPRDVTPIPVGRFDVSLDFAANVVNVRNLTMRRNGWDHPHVSNGDFCTGEMAGTVEQLLAERQIGAAVNLCLDALEHVNPEDSWGRNIVWWKEGEDVEPEPDYDE